jgi:hypothetical protein
MKTFSALTTSMLLFIPPSVSDIVSEPGGTVAVKRTIVLPDLSIYKQMLVYLHDDIQY